jgi:hypothetical protein
MNEKPFPWQTLPQPETHLEKSQVHEISWTKRPRLGLIHVPQFNSSATLGEFKLVNALKVLAG